MKRVCLFNFPDFDNPQGVEIRSFEWDRFFFTGSQGLGFLRFKKKWDTIQKKRAIVKGAEGVDHLYRSRDPQYMEMIKSFVETFKDYDLIAMSTFNPIHPEVFSRYLPKPRKVLGFIDDPYSTYLRGIPYLWAFDGAFYISPSYSKSQLFAEALKQWGCQNSYWWPLSPQKFVLPEKSGDDFFRNRNRNVVYVGLPYATKVGRLISLRQAFGKSFEIYGKWPLRGYSAILGPLLGRKVLWQKVNSLTFDEKTRIYWDTKIGFNMHLSESTVETGNLRMYEVPAHGMMLLCDKAGRDAHELIFSSEEAVYYDDLEDAKRKINYYLENNEDRINIAKNGYRRFVKNYRFPENLCRFLEWAINLRKAG
jgi:hypothetical protein